MKRAVLVCMIVVAAIAAAGADLPIRSATVSRESCRTIVAELCMPEDPSYSDVLVILCLNSDGTLGSTPEVEVMNAVICGTPVGVEVGINEMGRPTEYRDFEDKHAFTIWAMWRRISDYTHEYHVHIQRFDPGSWSHIQRLEITLLVIGPDYQLDVGFSRSGTALFVPEHVASITPHRILGANPEYGTLRFAEAPFDTEKNKLVITPAIPRNPGIDMLVVPFRLFDEVTDYDIQEDWVTVSVANEDILGMPPGDTTTDLLAYFGPCPEGGYAVFIEGPVSSSDWHRIQNIRIDTSVLDDSHSAFELDVGILSYAGGSPHMPDGLALAAVMPRDNQATPPTVLGWNTGPLVSGESQSLFFRTDGLKPSFFAGDGVLSPGGGDGFIEVGEPTTDGHYWYVIEGVGGGEVGGMATVTADDDPITQDLSVHDGQITSWMIDARYPQPRPDPTRAQPPTGLRPR